MNGKTTRTERSEEPSWYAGLRRKPELGEGFSAELMGKIREQAIQSERRPKVRVMRVVAISLGLACLAAAAIWLGGANGWQTLWPENGPGGIVNGGKPGTGLTDVGNTGNTGNTGNVDSGWRSFWRDGQKLLDSVAGGDFAAGQQNGVWWNFYVPFEQIKDSRIRIEATHQSGWTQTELRETVFRETGMEYPRGDGSWKTDNPGQGTAEVSKNSSEENFSRIPSRFALPLAGQWRFDIYIDDNLWGDVEYEVPDAAWAESPTFPSGAYKLRGVEGKVGILDPGFIAGKGNKAMWHFWGSDKELSGKLLVLGVQQTMTQPIEIFRANGLGAAHNGADAHLPSLMTMPTPGLWRLMAYIDGTLFGSVVVDVKKE